MVTAISAVDTSDAIRPELLVALGSPADTLDPNELTPRERAHALKEILKRYVTPEMVKFLPLCDLGAENPTDRDGRDGGVARSGERQIKRGVVLHRNEKLVKPSSTYFYLDHIDELPSPTEATLSVNEDAPPKGQAYTSNVLVTSPQGEIFRWNAVWKATHADHYIERDGTIHAGRAVCWYGLSSALSSFSDKELIRFMEERGRSPHNLYLTHFLWKVEKAMQKRENNLEERIRSFKRRKARFHAASERIGGPN